MNTKITLIGSLPPITGISPYCKSLFDALSKKINVEFIGFKDIYPELLYPGKSTKKLHTEKNVSNSIKEILNWKNPFSWMKAGLMAQGEIVHVQWWSYILAPIYLCFLIILKIRGKTILLTLHNITPHEQGVVNDFFNRLILSFGDHYVVHCDSNKKKLMERYHIDECLISKIPHGTLCVKNNTKISPEKAREKLHLDNGKKVILFFGFIRDYKGLDILLQAFISIRKEIEDALLVIAGESWEDVANYERIIQDNNLSESVVFHNRFIPDEAVQFYFKSADVVVLPYKAFDSQSGAGSIGLFFAKPLIVTRVGGLIDYVNDEQAIVEPNDVVDLEKKLINVLRHEELLKKLSRDSLMLSKSFNWDNIADATIELYQRILL